MSRSIHRAGCRVDHGVVLQAKRVLAVTLGALALSAHAQTQPSITPNPAAQQAPKQDAIQRLFSRVDTDGDGRLSAEEATRLPAISARFDEIDANGDGGLDPDEFHAGATAPVR